MSKKLERNDPCWCGSGKKYKNCHMRFDEKIHGFELEGHIVPGHESRRRSRSRASGKAVK